MTEFNLTTNCGKLPFNLSEKIKVGKFTDVEMEHILFDSDVREFIKLYEETLRKLGVDFSSTENEQKLIGVELAIFELRKLAGKKLC